MNERPVFSVVIPTRNARERLEATLRSIAEAAFDLSRVEVVVVDDGSTDGTYDALQSRLFPFALRSCRIDAGSQSAATNEALRRSSGRWILSSAQDVLFHPRLFEEHLRWHENHPDEEIVVLGPLPYPGELEVTPFMFYLVNGGYQFAYYLIKDRLRVSPNFLYAPNFSASRRLLLDVGGFDERFPFGCQDTDLGIRLVQRGARIIYNPKAIGYHNHPMTLADYCPRQEKVGVAVVNLDAKHPDHHGGNAVRDMAIRQYLMCSEVQLDRAHEAIVQLEDLLERGAPGYQELWEQALAQDGIMADCSREEHDTLTALQTLFKCYEVILGFHWAKGFLAGSIKLQGREHVERWIRARLTTGQASIQVKRTLERRLLEIGIEVNLHSPRDYGLSVVAHGLASYAEAVRFLEPYEVPPAANCNIQLLLVLEESAFSARELEKLAAVAEVVTCDRIDSGIQEALARCEAEKRLLSVRSDTRRAAVAG